MTDAELMRMLVREDVLIPALMAGSVVLIVAVRTVGGVIKSVSRERSRREIAAFIAEGTMTPEQGERLMKAGDRTC
ncbi:MAG: hypothetical protein JSR77_05130 [Planctomycetes bacterium]|nr:hypothetical protein [Planctomycetota bacterium]